MAKYGTGELVHFRDSEISFSVIPCMSVTIKTDNLSGRVTGVVDCGKEETEYHVDVNMPAKGVVIKVKVKESALLSRSEYVQKVIDDLMKKAEEFKKRYVPYAFYPLPSIEARFNNPFLSVDLGVAGGDKSATSVVDKKMSKSRCIKLLESYRAERDKVKKGCKFELCLRDSVVDEALERAIELLKE